jgi:hypothetical protein
VADQLALAEERYRRVAYLHIPDGNEAYHRISRIVGRIWEVTTALGSCNLMNTGGAPDSTTASTDILVPKLLTKNPKDVLWRCFRDKESYISLPVVPKLHRHVWGESTHSSVERVSCGR